MGKFIRQHAQSSLITSVAYDSFHQVLEVVFCKGGIYEYAKVSPSEYENLMSAPSLGQYFNQHIRKKPHYEKVRN